MKRHPGKGRGGFVIRKVLPLGIFKNYMFDCECNVDIPELQYNYCWMSGNELMALQRKYHKPQCMLSKSPSHRGGWSIRARRPRYAGGWTWHGLTLGQQLYAAGGELSLTGSERACMRKCFGETMASIKCKTFCGSYHDAACVPTGTGRMQVLRWCDGNAELLNEKQFLQQSAVGRKGKMNRKNLRGSPAADGGKQYRHRKTEDGELSEEGGKVEAIVLCSEKGENHGKYQMVVCWRCPHCAFVFRATRSINTVRGEPSGRRSATRRRSVIRGGRGGTGCSSW